jgi:hypothetical protein
MPEPLRPAWEAFGRQAERVEKARQTLLSCLPVGRVDPAPVPVGLDVLHDELTDIAAVMEEWRVDEIAEQWQRCHEAVGEALAEIEPARRVAESTTELEELLDAVTDVVEPLDVWGEAERAWLKLRVRS